MATIETYARPTWLYRYRSFGSQGRTALEVRKRGQELEALTERYVWCARFNQMNDPMEGFFRSSSGLKSVDGYEDLVDAVRGEKLGLGVASFSETWSNGLMWAHYADGFRGICIAYSVQRLLDGLDRDHALARVAYADKPHYLNLRGVQSEDSRARAILSTKSLPWAYEREWRLFAPCAGKAAYRSKAATRIYIGPRMSVPDRAALEDQLAGSGITLIPVEVDGYTVRSAQTNADARDNR